MRPAAPLGLLLAAALAGPAATQPAPPPAGQAPAPAAAQAAPNPDHGRQIAENGSGGGNVPPCAQCHGMNGAANGNDAFPRLDGQPTYYLFKQLNDYASGARDNPIMGPIAKALSETERQDAAAYYGALPAVATPASGDAKPDAQAMRRGWRIARIGAADQRVQGCGNCHGPEGMGLAPATPRLAGQWASYIRAQFEAFRSGSRKNDVSAVMRELSHHLTDDEIAAVSAYLAALQPAEVGR